LTEKPQFCISLPKGSFTVLNQAVDGFQEGELYVIGGPTKSGKTLLLQSLTYAISQLDVGCLWFSYEMPTRQFIESFPDDMFPFFFLPQEIHACRIDWFEERTIEAWEKYRIQVVFIDHLHFLFDMARIRNSSLEIGSYVRRIKQFAVKNRLIIFLVCHVFKIGPDVDELSHFHLRDSSFIAQESDCVIMIRRLSDPMTQAELVVDFHRRTGVIRRKIKLEKHHGYLWEVNDLRSNLGFGADT